MPLFPKGHLKSTAHPFELGEKELRTFLFLLVQTDVFFRLSPSISYTAATPQPCTTCGYRLLCLFAI